MREYADTCREVEAMQARADVLLGRVVDAYRWPEDIPEPTRFDSYSVAHINQEAYGEDLTSELAVAGRTSETAAEYLVGDVARLTQHLPLCWAKVVRGEAPLWQARKVVQECSGIDGYGWETVDETIAPLLGAYGMRRVMRAVTAVVAQCDPEKPRRVAQQGGDRFVHTGGDEVDPMTGWVSARVERADAIHLDAVVQLVADSLAAQGDQATVDERRARAFGLLANPSAVVQLIGVHTTRGMNPVPQTQADVDGILKMARRVAPVFTPHVQIYIHACLDTLRDPEGVARVESLGPVLHEQIAQLTKASRIHLTRVVHTDETSIAADQYEIPSWIREQVFLRTPHDIFPWSSIESRHLDIDHTRPYQPGIPGQTTPSNLGPLSRRAHRVTMPRISLFRVLSVFPCE
jgi:hypothetical protein